MRIFVENVKDKVLLLDYLPQNSNISMRQVKMGIKDKRVKINNSFAYRDTMVKNGDKIYYFEKEQGDNIIAEEMLINVLFEDEYFLIINKDAGIVVHPTQNIVNGTLANGVVYHYKQKNDMSIVRFVSRLDRDTSGIIVLAKDANSQNILSEQDWIKEYIAIVNGHLTEAKGIIDKPIGKIDIDDIKYSVLEEGKEAITEYAVTKKCGKYDMVTARLKTGRTHQIRVHMAYLGHSVVGDNLYGNKSEEINRQALHASRVKFIHPHTGEIIDINCPLPKDMEDLLNGEN